MANTLRIESGFDTLSNLHPDGKLGGDAVFRFLSGLHTYRIREKIESESNSITLITVIRWYESVEQFTGIKFFPTSDPLLDCMWGNDPIQHYHDDEYELYIKHATGSRKATTKKQFLAVLDEAKVRWRPITSIIESVHLLLDVFSNLTVKPPEDFFHYQPEDTIPDFRALLANLELLAKRGNEDIRLTFKLY